METKIAHPIQTDRITAHDPPASVGRRAPGGAFEALLGRILKDIDALKNETRDGEEPLSPTRIRKPEELASALQEADRRYRSTVTLGRSLAEAYEKTIRSVSEGK